VTRASDSEREDAVAHLREAAAEGRLDVEELVDRIDAAYAATTREELAPLTADLPAPTGAVFGPPERRATSFLLSTFGGSDRAGRWRVAEHLRVVNIFGGADLDLREATLAAPEVHITVISIFGGSDIVVPEGVHAELSSFAIFGGDDLKLGGSEPLPGAPVVHVRCVSIFGGTDVMTKRGRAKRRLPGLPPPPPPL
jgi:Domain of unknown function (DUF1707)/Cell wall-active antibiotics response 4TMS YvqF